MYAGLDAWMPVEGEVIEALGLRRAGADSLADTSSPVLDWITHEGITQLAIHFDVDVIEPKKFGPVVFNKPDAPADAWADVPRGRMAPDQVVRLLQDVAAACDVVGLAIAKYTSWKRSRPATCCAGCRCWPAESDRLAEARNGAQRVPVATDSVSSPR